MGMCHTKQGTIVLARNRKKQKSCRDHLLRKIGFRALGLRLLAQFCVISITVLSDEKVMA
jgi:hypothetical protein